ncbi:MAG: TetR/AcrR family transcriptional regulator [Proteobacteria bacterium]|nr:MAG: TetR/AcrR family transcriptional regulator [Pseudomonadota bacterium]
MRYSREHKAETHARIVRKASVLLRERGVHGVGVAELMKEAGLTHGGFYAHFASRDALLIEAVAHAMDRSIAHWRKITQAHPGQAGLADIVDAYLTPTHRDDPGYGCAIAALGAEIAREGAGARRMFAAKLEEMVAVLAAEADGATAEAARNEAIATLALMTGALVLARAAGGGAFSNEILSIVRARALADTTAAPKTAAGKPVAKKRLASTPAAKKPRRKAKS